MPSGRRIEEQRWLNDRRDGLMNMTRLDGLMMMIDGVNDNMFANELGLM